MAFSDAETTMVDDSGEAAVFDRGARQLARSANASAKVAGVPSGPYTANTVGAALSTATVKTNSRITVTYRGKSGPEAIAGANAAVNAYVALRRQAANQEASALARRSDEAVRVPALELAETSPARAAINARQEQLQTRIADCTARTRQNAARCGAPRRLRVGVEPRKPG